MKISEYFISKLRNLVARYDDKHHPKNIFMCKEIGHRNSCRGSKYKISENEPQCPIFKNNRCCGCCDLTTTCKYVVPCSNCYGWAVAAMGSYQRYYMNDATDTAEFGRMKSDEIFDWDYYHRNQMISRAKVGKYFRYKLVWYMIVKSANRSGIIEVINLRSNQVCSIDIDSLDWRNTTFFTKNEFECIHNYSGMGY